jgi:orotidine-5'-phosphate decarboxylase
MTIKLIPKQVLVALDVNSLEEASSIMSLLDKDLFRLKVGKQLFTSEGPAAVEKLIGKGYDVFLDLKLHDIPNTVSKALVNISNMGVWMTNIHLTGGKEMIDESVSAIKSEGSKTILIGVSLLTSLNDNNLNEIGFKNNSEDLVMNLAKIGNQSKIDGVVCSINDVSGIKSRFGSDFITVTPGVRMSQEKGDQKRSGSIYEAIKFGSDYVVLGRELTQSKNPSEVIKKIENLIQ